MNQRLRPFAFALIVVAMSQASPAEKLSNILREAKWDGIVGAWGDAETGGKEYRLTYAWKLKDRVLEMTSAEKDKESVALVGVDAKKGTIFVMGADSLGSSSLGEFKFEDNGDAVLGMLYTGPDGEQGAFSVRYHRENKDTITMTVKFPVTATMKLVRLKPSK